MSNAAALHVYRCAVSFGDCDPAGIAYYPNIYRWVDTAFHDFLARFGGHARLCAALGSVGFGLIETRARYRRPLRPGDRIEVRLLRITWRNRSVDLDYGLHSGGALACEAFERRGMFIAGSEADTLRAGDISGLRTILNVATP